MQQCQIQEEINSLNNTTESTMQMKKKSHRHTSAYNNN